MNAAPQTSFLKNNFDLIYLTAAALSLLLDLLTSSVAIEASSFILIIIGVLFSALPNRYSEKDERILSIRLRAGHMAFLFSLATVGIFMGLHRYAGVPLALTDTLRYILLFMCLYFSLVYAVLKRLL